MTLRDALVVVSVLLGAAAVYVQRRQVRQLVNSLENDPNTQFEVHRWATWYWLLNFPVVAVLFFFFPRAWVVVGLLLNTFYSLYANLATDYGAVSAAIAARGAHDSQHLDAIQAELAEIKTRIGGKE